MKYFRGILNPSFFPDLTLKQEAVEFIINRTMEKKSQIITLWQLELLNKHYLYKSVYGKWGNSGDTEKHWT